MTDAVILQGRLDAAEEAYDLLSTGQSEAVVKYEGFEVQYNRTNIANLHRYIRRRHRFIAVDYIQRFQADKRGIAWAL